MASACMLIQHLIQLSEERSEDDVMRYPEDVGDDVGCQLSPGRLHPRVGIWEGLPMGLPAVVHTSAVFGISTVYLRNMKEMKLNNEL